VLLVVGLTVATATGCVVDWTGQSGSYLLREKLDITRERTRDLERDLQTERARVDAIETRAADARRRYADSGASVQALMEDLTYVRGQLDSLQHSISRTGQLSEDMSFQLTAIEVRMGHIEGQLLERVPDYEAAPFLMMPFEDEPLPGDDPADGSGEPSPPPEGEGAATLAVDPLMSEDERMFRRGLELTQRGEWKAAGGALQAFSRAHPESGFWLEGQFLVGRCLYELAQYKAAITEFQKVIVRDDESAWAPRSMFMQGMAFESLGTQEDMEAAQVFYAELRRLYPRSDEAGKAKVRLDALDR
jgi:TolA-binding protein